MSPDVIRQLTEAGQAARDRQDRRDGPRPAFADNLGDGLRRQLDLRAAAMASGSRHAGLRPMPVRALAFTGLVLALLVSGLAWAAGFLQPPRDSVAASQSAAPSGTVSPSAPPSPSRLPSAAPSATGAASASIPVVGPVVTASATVSPSAVPPASTPTRPLPTSAHGPTATPAPPTGTPPSTPAPTPPAATPAPTASGIVDMGALSAADNLDLTVSFGWNAYTGPGLTAYAVFYELTASGLTPSYPTSTAWATAGASKTSVAVAGIPAGDYQVRAQALCGPSGSLFVCGQTNVIHVHLSASRGASPTPTP